MGKYSPERAKALLLELHLLIGHLSRVDDNVMYEAIESIAKDDLDTVKELAYLFNVISLGQDVWQGNVGPIGGDIN